MQLFSHEGTHPCTKTCWCPFWYFKKGPSNIFNDILWKLVFQSTINIFNNALWKLVLQSTLKLLSRVQGLALSPSPNIGPRLSWTPPHHFTPSHIELCSLFSVFVYLYFQNWTKISSLHTISHELCLNNVQCICICHCICICICMSNIGPHGKK